jgi:hypothetical protein
MSSDGIMADDLDEEELEYLEYNPEVQYAFNNRWYRIDNLDTYYVLVNNSKKPILKGEQVFFNYGNLSN